MTSLAEFPISARAAAGDLERARRWYEDRLGLLPEHEDPGGAWYRFAGETWLYLYAKPGLPRTRSRAGRSRTSRL